MKIKFGFLKGNCWKFKFQKFKYWNRKVIMITFYKFFLNIDKRKNLILEMMDGNLNKLN